MGDVPPLDYQSFYTTLSANVWKTNVSHTDTHQKSMTIASRTTKSMKFNKESSKNIHASLPQYKEHEV